MVKRKRSEAKASPIRCPTCDTSFYYYRAKAENYRCRKCGTLFVWSEKKGKTVKKPARKVKA